MTEPDYLRIAAAFLLVVGLIGLIGLLARRLLPGVAPGMFAPARRREATLRVEETLLLDPKRRVVVVAREGMRYLLLTGATGDVLLDRWQADAVHAATAGPDAPTADTQLHSPQVFTPAAHRHEPHL